MNFSRLTAHAQRTAARLMGKTAAGAQEYAWFGAAASSLPETIAAYTLAAGPAMKGPARRRVIEAMGFNERADDLCSITVDGTLLTYDPVVHRTTLLFGTVKATAERFIVIEWRREGGMVEIDAKKTPAVPAS